MHFGGDMNQRYIEQSLHQMTKVVHRLQRDGFVVESMEVSGGGKPRIKIGWNPKVGNLGEPSVFSRGNNGLVHETYLVQFEGCQVSWIRK